MQINFLKDMIEDIAGKQAREIVDLLAGEKDVNEFLIAKKLKLTINQTRNILYRLSDSGLVSFTRKKDKRKGWYIYFWTLNSLKSLDLLERKISKEVNRLENQLKNRKTKRFYICKTCNVEVGEETALLNQFTCNECGQVYALSESDKIIKELGDKIFKLKKSVEVIKEEKGKIVAKEEKKIKRKTAREKRKTKKGKKAKKAKKKIKKTAKKKPKKKVKKSKKPKKKVKKKKKKKVKKTVKRKRKK